MAVFEIHIDKDPVATIKPRIILSVLAIAEMIESAIRLCKFHRSYARAIMKPPMNKKTVSSP